MPTVIPSTPVAIEGTNGESTRGAPRTPSVALAACARRLTIAEYDRLIESGLLPSGDKVELVAGMVIDKMGRNRPHIQAVKRGLEALTKVLPAGWHVAKEDPVAVPEWSKPEPDLAIVRGAVGDYDDRDVTAADIALVVEVADSSLAIDQVDKARVYAAGGIPTYWIVNLVERRLEVHTDPGPEGYRAVRTLSAGNQVPVVVEQGVVGLVAVSDILP